MKKKLYPEPFRRGKFYYFTVSENGKRRNISTGLTGKEKAREIVRDYINKHRRGTDLTFSDYADQYFIWETCPRVGRLLDEGKSISRQHVKNSRRWLEKYILPDSIFSNIKMKEITRGDVLDLRRRLRTGILKTKTGSLNKVVKTLKTILSEACFRDDIPSNPGAQIGKINYEPMVRGVFEISEVKDILHYQPGELKTNALADAVYTTLLLTGVRAGELRALRWGSVNLETGRTKITEAFKTEVDVGTPKWGKIRDIVLSRLLLYRLQEWRDQTLYKEPEDFIFSNLDGKPISRAWLKFHMEKLLKAAEADDRFTFEVAERWLTPHSCRHTLNTILLSAGISPLIVQAFLGWSSTESMILPEIQKNYTRFQLLRLEDVADKLDELFGEKEEKIKLNTEKIS